MASLANNTWAKQAYMDSQLAKGKTPTLGLKEMHIENLRVKTQESPKQAKNIITIIENEIVSETINMDETVVVSEAKETPEKKLKGQWMASWRQETKKIIEEIENSTGKEVKDIMKPKEVNNLIKGFKFQTENKEMDKVKQHSLKWMPKYVPQNKPQEYLLIDDEDVRVTLAKFRIGNAGLGYRNGMNMNICPACKNGKNCESHLIFQCQAPDIAELKNKENMKETMDKFNKANKKLTNADEMLKSFLQGQNTVLHERGTYLYNILNYFTDTYCKEAIDNQDNVQMDHNYS